MNAYRLKYKDSSQNIKCPQVVLVNNEYSSLSQQTLADLLGTVNEVET